MEKGESARGHCLCGAVHIHVMSVSPRVAACHCDMCRRWAGGPLLAVSGGTDVRIEGSEQVSIFRSSDWGERAFCRSCGTHLYYRLVETGEHEIPVGLLEESPAWSFDEEVFVEEKPAYYAFANETEKFTGAEVMERDSPGTA